MCIRDRNKPTVFINPEITFKSPEKFEVWDDCMSFPNLLVRLYRHNSIRIKFWDESWQEQELFLEDDLSLIHISEPTRPY